MYEVKKEAIIIPTCRIIHAFENFTPRRYNRMLQLPTHLQ